MITVLKNKKTKRILFFYDFNIFKEYEGICLQLISEFRQLDLDYYSSTIPEDFSTNFFNYSLDNNYLSKIEISNDNQDLKFNSVQALRSKIDSVMSSYKNVNLELKKFFGDSLFTEKIVERVYQISNKILSDTPITDIETQIFYEVRKRFPDYIENKQLAKMFMVQYEGWQNTIDIQIVKILQLTQ